MAERSISMALFWFNYASSALKLHDDQQNLIVSSDGSFLLEPAMYMGDCQTSTILGLHIPAYRVRGPRVHCSFIDS